MMEKMFRICNDKSGCPFLTLLVYFIILAFLFQAGKSFSQPETVTDSLENKLANTEEGTMKAEILSGLVEAYMITDPSKALDYSDQLLDLSNEIDYNEGIVDACSFKGRLFRNAYSYDTAIFYTDKAIELASEIDDHVRMGRDYSEKGHTVFRKSGPAKGIEFYRKSYNVFREINDSTGLTTALNGIGVMHMRLANYDSAVIYLLDMIRISEKLEDEEEMGKGYLNLGISYYETFDFDNAKTFLEKSIIINEKLGNSRYMSIAYNNLGNLAYDDEDLEGAFRIYKKSLELSETTGDMIGMSNALVNLGNIDEEKNNYRSAYEYYKKGKDIKEKIGDLHGYMLAYKNMGLIHERWGDYRTALDIYDSCLVISEKIDNIYTTRELYFNMFKTYELLGDYRNAFIYQGLHDAVEDSIYNIRKAEAIADFRLKYEKEKDQAQILALKNEALERDLMLNKKTLQSNIFLFTGLGVILVILFVFLYFRQKAVKNRIIAEQKIRQLEEEKKVLAAKALVEGQEDERKRIARELHDGLGVLLSTVKMQFISLKDRSPENRPMIDRATQLLEQASGDVRQISHNMMPGLLTKMGLFEAVDELFDKVDDTEDIIVEKEIPVDAERLPENKEIMLYRIIQEMLNNTLKHAEAGKIMIKMEVLPGKLHLSYSDDGKGFNVEEVPESKSLGLQSISSRVNFLNGELSIDSEPGAGTAYSIEIPV